MSALQVVASWSGGIDSTAVAAHLLLNGYDTTLVTLNIYGGSFGKREKAARSALLPVLERCATKGGGKLEHVEAEASWIWAFSPDGHEIPRRNKHIMDHLLTTYCMPKRITNIGMGEYIGADTWLVRDHVGAADADHRSLAAYLYHEYGIDYRLFSLADFGESRYKVDRVRLLTRAVGLDAAALTSNCLYDYEAHCGECYKCVERAAAFLLDKGVDPTAYLTDPQEHETFPAYIQQMQGGELTVPWASFESPKMPAAAHSASAEA